MGRLASNLNKLLDIDLFDEEEDDDDRQDNILNMKQLIRTGRGCTDYQNPFGEDDREIFSVCSVN
jgi:hypothetical protein